MFKYPFVTCYILTTLDVQRAYQALNIHHAGHRLRELKDSECAVHGRMCPDAVGDDPDRNIPQVRYIDQMIELCLHTSSATDGAMQHCLVDNDREFRRRLLRQDILPSQFDFDELVDTFGR